MKKVISVIISIMLILTGIAHAEIDYSSMNAQELQEIIFQAGAALQRLTPVENELVLYDRDGYTVSIDSVQEDAKKGEIQINLLTINDTDEEASFYFPHLSINGWEVEHKFDGSIAPKTKSRERHIYIRKIYELAGISSFSEIQSIEAYGTANVKGIYHKVHYIMSYSNNEIKILSREYIEK